MAWLRSEQSLLHHPKTVHLKVLLKTDTATVIGKLHMLWWWCLDYAIDGDLSKKEAKVIEDACEVPLKLLIRAGFVDSRPYRRIHSWWEIQGNYLRNRFKDQPEKWKRIQQMYENDLPMSIHRGRRMGKLVDNPTDVDRGRTDVEYGRTDVERKRARESGSLEAPPLALNGNGNTELPSTQFEIDHLLRRLNDTERLQTKLREAGFLNGRK